MGGTKGGGASGAGRRTGAVELRAGARTVRLSHPDKVYFPERGFTKLDVARYFQAVGQGMLRALHDRPTTLERFPEGVTGESFYQKRAPKNLPEWIPTGRISFPSGRHADEICPTEVAAVLWAANLGCLTFHPWPVRRRDTEHPDELRIDLDPQPGCGYPDAARAAELLREVLTELDLVGWPKTSGGRGLHVFVPIAPEWTFPQARRAVIAIGRELERRAPALVTTAWWKEERGAKVFFDYNQMARDRTVASAYSVRSTPRATVSAPLRWPEVAEAAPEDFDLASMPGRYAAQGDVHADMAGQSFRLDAALELAARDEREHRLGELPYPPEHPKAPGEPRRVQPSRARRDGPASAAS